MRIVLGNGRIHTAKMIQKTTKILNLNLIFLRLCSLDLNPMGNVWRVIKKTTYNSTYNSTNDLINLF